jgi:hypothetical protein
LRSGFAFGTQVQTVGPVATAFNTASAPIGGNNGTFAFTGLSLTDAPVGFVPVTPPAAPGVYTYQPVVDFDNSFPSLPTITITVLASCPSITAQDLTGCLSGNLSGFVTGGTSPYLFSQTGTAVGGSVSLDTAGNYSFGGVTGSFQYFAKDVAGCPSNVATVNVAGNPSLPTGSIVYNMSAGVPLTQSINVTGGTPPYTLITTGSFPIVNGSVTFNSFTNEFTFTQTTPGASRMTAQIIDANGCASNTRNIYFYSCPDGGMVSAAVGNNNNQIALIYAICYPSYVPQGQQFNITATVVNVNPEGAVPTGPFVDFIPDPTQLAFAPGLSFAGNGPIPPEINIFNPAAPSDQNFGGQGSITYDPLILSGVSVDLQIQINANAQGAQTYIARNLFNPGNNLVPPVSIFVGPPCDLATNPTTESLCVNSSTTGNLESLVSAGTPPYTFGPTGSAVGGQVNINPSGVYTFTADTGFSGAGSFQYEVTDSNTGCSPVQGTVNVLISSPIAGNTSIGGCIDSTVTGNLQPLVTSGFSPYFFAQGSSVSGGGVTVQGNGDFSFTPNPGLSGPAGFDYVVFDSVGCTAAGLVNLNFGSPVIAPSGIDLCTNISASGNLSSQVSGGTLPYTFGPTGSSVGGTATIQPGGGYVFTPTTGFVGTASFDYQVVDGGGCTATGTLQIDYDAPIASAGSATICENNSLIGGTLSATGGTPPYTFAIVTNGTFGTATITNATTGTFNYVPDPDSFGTDSFTFQVTDANGCVSNIATFTITINQSPITNVLAINDCINTPVVGGLAQQVVGPLPLLFSLTGTPFGGTASVDPIGNFTFIPTNGFTGPAGFVYEVIDGNGCNATGAVDITVSTPVVSPSGVNTCLNTPVSGDLAPLVTSGFPGYTFGFLAAAGGTASVSSTGLYNFVPFTGFSGPAGLVYSVTDSNGCFELGTVDININSLAATNAPILSCEPSFSSNLNFFVTGGTGALTFTGPLSISCGQVSIAADGSFTYTAPSGFTGSCDFTYQVSDAQGCNSTGAISVAISDPIANSISIDDCTNTSVSGSLASLVIGVPPFVFSLTGNVNNGSATVDTNGDFIFTPNTGFTGQGGFVYEVVDNNACSSTGAVDVTIDAPVISPTAINTCLNTPISGDLASLVSEGFPPYTFTLVNVSSGANATVSSTGIYNFVPSTGYSGPAGFIYSATDTNDCVNTGTVSVTVDSLAAGNGNLQTCNTSVSGILVDYVNGGIGTLVFTGPLSSTCGTVTISPNGAFVYNAPTGFTGPCTFVYGVSDSIDCSSTGAITIVANTAPVVVDALIIPCANQSYSDTLAGLVQNNPPQPLTFAIVTQPTHGTLSNFNPATGAYTYTPQPGFIGLDSFQYQVTDAIGCVSNVGTITVDVISCCPMSDNPEMMLILQQFWGFSAPRG